MKKALILGGVAWLVIGVSGCGSDSDQLIKDEIRAMNDLAGALEAKAPPATVATLQNHLREVTDQVKALNLSDKARQELFARHQQELTKAGMRLGQAHLGNSAEQTKAMAGWLQGQQAGTKPPQ